MIDKIDKVRHELNIMRRTFLHQMDALENRLRLLEEYAKKDIEQHSEDLSLDVNWESLTNDVATSPDTTSQKHANSETQPNQITAQPSEKMSNSAETYQAAENANQTEQSPKHETLSTQSKASQKPSPLAFALNWMIELVVHHWQIGILWHKVIDTYHDYKTKGKAPLFLFTASGITILVIGLGFLLQLTFLNLTPGLRVGSGYVLALAVLLLSDFIHRKKPSIKGFASALAGLGLLIAFLCSYFIGPYFNLVSPITAFSIFALITAIGFGLCFRFNASILSNIALLGGVFLPWLSGAPQVLSLTYTGYLFILNIASLVLARNLHLRSLTILTIIATSASLEYQLVTNAASQIGFIALIHGFFLLYAMAIYFSARQKLDAKLLSLLSTNLIVYVLINWQWYQLFNQSTPFLPYLLMGSFFSGIALFSLLKKRIFELTLSVLHAGVLIGLSALALLGADGSGVIWAIEGILLFILGFIYKQRIIRIEAYIALIVSLVLNAWTLFQWWFNPDLNNIIPQLTYLAAMGVAAQAIIAIPKWLKGEWPEQEGVVCYCLKEWVSLWVLGATLALIHLYIPFLLAVAPLGPAFILVNRHSKHRLAFSHYLAFISFGLSFLLLSINIADTGTLRFSQWSWQLKLNGIIFFSCCWLLPSYYQNKLRNGSLAKMMNAIKLSFWILLPIIALPSLFRRIPEWFGVFTWLSTIGVSIIYWQVKHWLLGLELLLIVFIASIATAASWLIIEPVPNVSNLIALLLGITFFTLVIKLCRSYQKKCSTDVKSPFGKRFNVSALPFYPKTVTMSYYLAPILLSVIVFSLTEKLSYVFLSLALYFFSVVFLWQKLIPLRHKKIKHFGHQLRLGWLFTLSLILLGAITDSPTDLSIAVFVTALLGYMLHRPHHYRSMTLGQHQTLPVSLWCYQITVVFCYLMIINSIAGHIYGPILSVTLILHSITLLFIIRRPWLKSLEKLGLGLFILSLLKIFLYDMRDFSMIEKVISFIVIGIVLLIAAFQYQKLKERTEAIDSNSIE
ncbi:DUF2339 domain-containing protein [Pleionea sediminis]|uniref:DUF2339 domain-containing protein n=1 Tax=Pleionea sediminis TaxID=2569479 RepID=UPI0011868C90|nr:DUF2339 domain-containing protein [Pleionea sediminis]